LLHIQTWDAEAFYLNKFLSYASIPLINIVDGPIQHTVQCREYKDDFKQGKLNATVNMKINVAEIWDFYLEFMDWRTTSLQDLEDPMMKETNMSPYLVFQMDSAMAIEKSVETTVQKNTFLPYWDKIDRGILFRGTYHELKNQELIVSIYKSNLIGSDLIGQKIIQLRDVVDEGFAKGDVVIHRKESDNNVDDDDLDKPAQTCIVQGTVNIGTQPKYKQSGEDDTVAMKDTYLCVKINEANVFGDLSDGGDAQVWIDVIWAGMTKQTRKFKRPNVNEKIYFKIPVPPDARSNQAKLDAYLAEELQTKSEFQIQVWADTHKTTIDNIGMGTMRLSMIASNGDGYVDHEFYDPVKKEKF